MSITKVTKHYGIVAFKFGGYKIVDIASQKTVSLAWLHCWAVLQCKELEELHYSISK